MGFLSCYYKRVSNRLLLFFFNKIRSRATLRWLLKKIGLPNGNFLRFHFNSWDKNRALGGNAIHNRPRPSVIILMVC